jgi:hypothetical protein
MSITSGNLKVKGGFQCAMEGDLVQDEGVRWMISVREDQLAEVIHLYMSKSSIRHVQHIYQSTISNISKYRYRCDLHAVV